MNKEFNQRVKFFRKANLKPSDNDISDFEISRTINLPEDYKMILKEFGSLKRHKTDYYFNESSNNIIHLINGTLDLNEQELIKYSIWDNIENSNQNVGYCNYLPIVSTYSSNYFFLIAITGKNTGKIYDYNDDFDIYEPKLISNSIFDFFTNQIYCSFSSHNESGIGTIEIRRYNGTEIWDLTSANLSITNKNGKKSLNFWAESYYKLLTRLEDSGDTPVMFEIKFPIIELENIKNPLNFEYHKLRVNDNWGEESIFEYYDNLYYYEHDSFDNLIFEIVKDNSDFFHIRVVAEKDDPISYEFGKAKFIITAKLNLSENFNGYWCEN
jgi:hypothetical protein